MLKLLVMVSTGWSIVSVAFAWELCGPTPSDQAKVAVSTEVAGPAAASHSQAPPSVLPVTCIWKVRSNT